MKATVHAPSGSSNAVIIGTATDAELGIEVFVVCRDGHDGEDEEIAFEVEPAKDGRHYNVGNCAFWLEIE